MSHTYTGPSLEQICGIPPFSRFPFLLTNFPLHCLPMLLMLSSAAPAASLVSATNQFSFQTHVVPRRPPGAHHNMPLFQPTPAASIYSLAVGPSPQWRALLAGVESLDIFHPLPVFVSTLSFFLPRCRRCSGMPELSLPGLWTNY